MLPYLVATPILFISGGFIVYYLIMPLAIKFFLGFETVAEPGVIAIQLEAKVNEYLSLIMRLIFAFGISFQLPVVLSLLARQFLIFILGYFAYFGAMREGEVVHNQFLILTSIILGISFIKLAWLILLKKYRALGNNSRTTVVVGYDDSSKNIIKLQE